MIIFSRPNTGFFFNLALLNLQKDISLLLLLVLFGAPVMLFAQNEEKTTFPLERFYVDRKKGARSIFKNFRLGVSTGYGNTFFSHDLSGFAIYQEQGKSPQIFRSGAPPTVRFSNWVNSVGVDSSGTKPGSYLINSDSAKLGFRGNALNIPLKLTLHYEFKRYRIGGGYSWEYMSIGSMHPYSHSDKVGLFNPPSPSGFMKKYFGSLGVSFARLDNYLLTADVNIGGFKPGANFNSGVITKGIYFNLGVTAERELSEYLRLFVRPSFDFKSYTLNLPGGGGSISHSINALYVNVGLTYTLPELRKCFKKECMVQINHAHGNKEYRSRVHPVFKKQNPGYGEDNPPIRFKGRNKKKLNPY